MGTRIRRTLAAITLTLAASLAAAQPAQAAPLSYCIPHTICSYDDVFGWDWSQVPHPVNRDVGDAPRNQCLPDFHGGIPTMLFINNSNYRWDLFRTGGCTGSHIEIPPYSTMTAPDGWEEVHAWVRTSSTS